ncbi:MAG TPA: hypothetical protein ENJ80_13325 [Gammaproteobacteria bacterium]|nr:hypothetical protein [Gammaproteobacteria bacterium]
MHPLASRLTLVLLVLFTLTGAECAFVARSGSSNDDKDKNSSIGLVVGINDGRLVDGPVQGVGYVSGALTGITGSDGEFRYEAGNTVRFFIGDITLGEAVPGKPLITPLDLVPGGTLDTPAVINIARLLQTLDVVPGDRRITIPETLHRAAVHDNVHISAALGSLDFSDETAFINAAAQLTATLTASYPFTAVLVDGVTARRHLAASLAEAGIE